MANGIIIGIDATSEVGEDSCALAIWNITSPHCYLVDVGFIPASTAQTSGMPVPALSMAYSGGELCEHVTARQGPVTRSSARPQEGIKKGAPSKEPGSWLPY